MPTFTELQAQLRDAKDRKAIFQLLIEHIDTNFLPVANQKAERVLLNDDRQEVPAATFEAIVNDTLQAEVKQLDNVIAKITATELAAKKKKDEEKPEKKDGKAHKVEEKSA